MTEKDARIKIMNEVLAGIKVPTLSCQDSETV